MDKSRNGSIIVGVLVVVVVVSTAFFAGTETGRDVAQQAYETGRKVVQQACDGVKRILGDDGAIGVKTTIDSHEIAYATTNMFHVFRDAQYDYIHRHDGTMARSITELGNGFSIGSFGSLIYEEIWLARLDRPEEEYVSRDKQSRIERDILTRPYRYAILPVEKCFSEALDRRTTCVLAIPVAPDDKPILLLLGGPIRSDPQDFYRPYQIHKISEEVSRKAFRDAAKEGTPVDKSFLDRNLPGWNVPSAATESNVLPPKGEQNHE